VNDGFPMPKATTSAIAGELGIQAEFKSFTTQISRALPSVGFETPSYVTDPIWPKLQATVIEPNSTGKFAQLTEE
jgi:hypothetical protein